MIKSDLVTKIAGQNPHLYQRDVENIVNAILNEITQTRSGGNQSQEDAAALDRHLAGGF